MADVIYNKPSVAPTSMLSQAELLRRLDPQGNAAEIAEALNETNEIIQDIKVKEGNLPNGDEQTIRNGLPTVYWRQLNRGVPASHSTTVSVQETCGQMEARSQIDTKVLDLNGLSAAFRTQESKPFLESMTQQYAHTLFYGDARKKSEGFTGFAPRYSTLDTSKALCAKNVIDCGGTGDSLTSIWIVGWGDNVYCPYPKGSKMGLQTKDLGELLVDDDAGNKYMAYCTIYDWNVGLMVRDWRYVVRLANIDVNELYDGKGIGSGDVTAEGSSNILMKITQGLTKIPRGGKPSLKMYMNSDVHAGLDVVAARCHSSVIKYMDATEEFGSPDVWSTFKGVPMRQVDQIINGENQVK